MLVVVTIYEKYKLGIISRLLEHVVVTTWLGLQIACTGSTLSIEIFLAG